MDTEQNAVVHIDMEDDHFEAVKEYYYTGKEQFIRHHSVAFNMLPILCKVRSGISRHFSIRIDQVGFSA
jgi:hypothetical protein